MELAEGGAGGASQCWPQRAGKLAEHDEREKRRGGGRTSGMDKQETGVGLKVADERAVLLISRVMNSSRCVQ